MDLLRRRSGIRPGERANTMLNAIYAMKSETAVNSLRSDIELSHKNLIDNIEKLQETVKEGIKNREESLIRSFEMHIR